MNADHSYVGTELELFSAAHNWKRYWAGKIRPHLGKSVLEVGAGLGANTAFLMGATQEDWLCLEPDGALAGQIPQRLASFAWSGKVKTFAGTLHDLPDGSTFDTILYVDVLEHIEHDHAEMAAAWARLKRGGKIIVLSPAHPSLFTGFDAAIGHYRRYTKAMLRASGPSGARLIQLFALDSCGLMASIANKLVLHQRMPSAKQIAFWDGWLVPTSRITDPLLGYSLGKSLIAIWQKE